MSLTNEDVAVVRAAIKEEVRDAIKEDGTKMLDVAIDEKIRPVVEQEINLALEKFDQKFDPIRDALKQVLKTQITVVEDLSEIKNKVTTLSYHLESTKLKRGLDSLI